MKILVVLLVVLGIMGCEKESSCYTIPTTVDINSNNVENIRIESSIDIVYKINNGTIRIETETNSWLFIHNQSDEEITIKIKEREFKIAPIGTLSYPISCYYGY